MNPTRTSLLRTTAPLLACLSLLSIGHAAVPTAGSGDIAIYVNGGSAGPTIAQGATITHDFATNARQDATFSRTGTDITLGATGYYMAIYNSQFDSTSGSNRSEIQGFLSLASSDLPIGWSQGYIRRASNADHCVISGVAIFEATANDILQLKSSRTDNNSAGVTRTAGNTVLQLIKLDDSANMDYARLSLAANATGPDSTTNVTVPYDTTSTLSAGFTHGTPGELTLVDGGKYLVTANTYVNGPGNRTTLTQRLTLDGVAVPGGTTVVYLRGTAQNSCGDGAAAIGMIVEADPGDILRVQGAMGDGDETTTFIADKCALTVVKIPDAAQIRIFDDNNTTVNPATDTPRTFNTQVEVDPSFSHTIDDSEVMVNYADDYLFLGSFYDPDDAVDRAVPHQGWSLNGAVRELAGQSARYTRNENDGSGVGRQFGNTSGFIGDGLAATDTVEMVFRELGASGANGANAVSLQGIRLGNLFGAPAVSTNRTFGITVSTTGTITTDFLAAFDVDTADTGLTYTVTSTPVGGTLQINGVAYAAGTNESFTQQDLINNVITFDAGSTENPAGGFDFTVSDGADSDASSFVVNIAQAIVMGNDSTNGTDEDTALTEADLTAGANLLSNDTGSTLVVTSHDTVSANGATITVNADGTFTYDPNGSLSLQGLGTGDSVTNDTFSYTVTDSIGATASATVTIASVSGIEDGIGGAADDVGGSTTEGANLTGALDVLTNDGLVHQDSGGNELILNYDASTSAGTGVWENTGNRNTGNGYLVLTSVDLDPAPTTTRSEISKAYLWNDSADLARFDAGVGRGIHDIISGNPDQEDASWEFWVQPASGFDSAVMTIFETGGGSGFGVILDNGILKAATELDGGSGTESAVSYDLVNDPLDLIAGAPGAAAVEADFQQFAAVINNNEGVTLFVNGIQVDQTTTGSTADWDGGDDSGFGRFQGTNHGGFTNSAAGTRYDAPFLGSMAIVRLYDGLLTPQQVLQNYAWVATGLDVEGDTLVPQGVIDSSLALQGAGVPATLASGATVTMNTASPFNFTYDPSGIPGIADLRYGESFADTFTYQIGSGPGETAQADVAVTVFGTNQAGDDLIAATESVVTSYTANRVVGNDDHGVGVVEPRVLFDANRTTASTARLNYDTVTVSLPYDTEVADFGVGLVVTGTTSGATGTIASLTDNGTDGILNLTGVSGTFQDDEQITDAATGDALVNGAQASNSFTLGQVVTGTSSGATGTIEEVNGGHLILNTVSGAFLNNEQITDPLGGDALANGNSFVVWENEGSDGAGFDATVTAGTLKTAASGEVTSNFGAIGQAFEDIVATHASFDAISTQDLTIEIWFKPDPAGTGKQLLFESGGSVNGTSLAYNNSTGIATFKCDGGTDSDPNQQLQVDASGINKNEFNQLIAVYDRDNPGAEDTLTLYVNSNPASFDGVPNAVSPTPNPTGVNKISGSNGSGIGVVNDSAALSETGFVPFDGQIALMRVYSRKLSVAEIEENFDRMAQPITQFTGDGAPGPTVTTSTLGATVTLNADGSFDYDATSLNSDIPDGNVVQDTFTYGIGDGEGGIETATVTVDVTGVGSFLAVNDDVQILEGATATAFDPLANDNGAGTATVQIQELVSDFSNSIPTGTVNGESADFLDGSGHGWQFLWNAPTGWTSGGTFDSTTGALGSIADYQQLVWDDTLQGWLVDADGTESNAGAEPGAYLRISPDGSGIPGAGATQTTIGGNDKDRCLILAFTVDSDGVYGIADSTISIGGSTDGITIETSVGSTAKSSTVIAPNTSGSFDENLGAMNTGDTIYIAICPNGTRATDFFTGLDFNLVKLPLATSPIETASAGTFTTNGSTITYDPNGAFENLALGESVFESITYIIVDGGDVSSATFTVEIQGENDAPSGFDDVASTDADSTVAGNLVANDTDPDTGEALSLGVAEVQGATGNVGFAAATDSGGSVTVQADGSFVYDPSGAFDSLPPGASATDTFTYLVEDVHGLDGIDPGDGTATALVTITINGVEDGVIANTDSFSVDVGATLDDNLISNDVSIDTGDSLSLVSIDLTGTQGIVGAAVGQVIGAHGTVSLDIVAATPTATTVNYGVTTLNNPVVIARPVSENGPDAVAVRISNVNAAAGTFDIRLVELPSLDGDHPSESVSWVVLEAGQHQLPDGALLEVGSVSTAAIQHDGTGGSSWESVDFATIFNATPVVFNCLQTEDGGIENDELFATRMQNVSLTGFDVALEDWEGDTGARNVPETIGWVAIEPGTGGYGNGPYEAGSTGLNVTHDWFTINFAGSYAAVPDFIASMMTIGGADPSNVRYRNLGTSSVQVRSAEDSEFEAETTHAPEDIAYLVLGGSGDIIGYPQGSTAGAFTYEPSGALVGLANGATATDTFTYTVSDGKGNTSTEAVTITVTGTNVAPQTATSLDRAIIDAESPVSLGDIVAADRNAFSGITTAEAKDVDFPANDAFNFTLTPVGDAFGFSFEVAFTPTAADLAAGETRLVWEIGGSSNGTGIYLVDGVPHLVSKMNGGPGNEAAALDDTDWTGNVVSVPLTSYVPVAGIPTSISGIFDLDSLTYSVNGSASVTATFTNRAGASNWSGDDSISIGAKGTTGGPGGVSTTGGALFESDSINDLENGSDAVSAFCLWNDSDGGLFSLNILPEDLTASVAISGWTSSDDGAITGGGLVSFGGGVYGFTGDAEAVNTALAGLQFSPAPGLTTYPVSLVVTINDPDAAAVSGTITIDYTAIGNWRFANGLALDGSEDGDDADGDKLANLLEFGFGTDIGVADNVPLNPDGTANGTPTTLVDFAGGPNFEALFIRRDDFNQSGSLSYTVQFSGDLVTFHDSTAPVTIKTDSTDDPDYHVASVPYPPLLPDGKKARFYRVEVSEVP